MLFEVVKSFRQQIGMSGDDIKKIRSEIESLAGRTKEPGYGANHPDACEMVWREGKWSFLPYGDWKSLVFTTEKKSKRKRRKSSNHNGHKPEPADNLNLEFNLVSQPGEPNKNGKHSIVFGNVVKKMANSLGRIPDENILLILACECGYSREIVRATRIDMEAAGYTFSPMGNFTKVMPPISPEEREIIELENRLNFLKSKRQNKE